MGEDGGRRHDEFSRSEFPDEDLRGKRSTPAPEGGGRDGVVTREGPKRQTREDQ